MFRQTSYDVVKEVLARLHGIHARSHNGCISAIRRTGNFLSIIHTPRAKLERSH